MTETWLRDGRGLDNYVDDLALGAGLGMMYRNRGLATNGVVCGGVAALWRKSLCSMSKLELLNPSDFKVLVYVGKLTKCSRKLVVVACYIPPGYPKARG